MYRSFVVHFSLLLAATLVLGACSPSLSEDELLARAGAALEQGKVEAAVIDAKTVLQRDANNAAARALLGEAYLFQQNPGFAADELARALAFDENSASRLLYAEALVAAGRREVLLEQHAEGLFASVGDSPRYMALLGLAQAAGGDTWAADETFARAMAEAEDVPEVTTAYAQYLMRYKAGVEEARRLLETTVTAHPERAEAWSTLGNIRQLMGNFEQAEDAYAKAAGLNRYRFTDRLNLVVMRIELGKTDIASEELERLEALDPGNLGVDLVKSRLLFEAGDYAAVIEELSSVLSASPKHSAGLYMAAMANIQQGNLATGQVQLTTFLADQPGHVRARLQLAALNLRTGDPRAAERLARDLLEDDDANIAAMGILSAALSAQQRHSESAEILQQLSGIQDAPLRTQMALGQEFMLSGQRERGIEEWEKVRDAAPGEAAVRERLILAHLAGGDPGAARAEAEDFLAHSPGAIGPLLLLGRVAMHEADANLAADYYSRALQLESGNAVANSGMAAVAIFNNDLDAARAHYLRTLEDQPDHTHTLISLAKLEELRGDRAATEAALVRALESSPGSWEARRGLARIRLDARQGVEAVALLAAGEAEQASNPDYWLLLTLANLEAKDLRAASQAGKRLLALVPDDPRALLLSAQIDLRLSDPASAEGKLRQASTFQTEDTAIRKLLIDSLVAQNKLDLALTEIAALPAEVAAELPVRVVKARIDLSRGGAAEAEPVFREAFDSAPDTMRVLLLASALWQQEEQEESLQLLADWLAEHPDDLAVRNQLAANQLQAGKDAAAREQYEALLQATPDSVLVLNNLGWLLREEDPRRALRYVEKANRLAPENANVKDTYAMVQYQLGAHEEALQLNQRALDLAAGDPGILYHRALILIAADRRDEAQAILAQLAEAPAFAQQQEVRELLGQIRGA